MSIQLVEKLVNPIDGTALSHSGNYLNDVNGSQVAQLKDGVWSFLKDSNDFYEGAYLNRIKYMPKKDNWLGRLPFWLVGNGYVWEVCKTFAPGSLLLEMGCAGGVDFLASRYQMIGLDFSLQSLRCLNGYKLALQADAENLPFAKESLDGAISSYFWEHIAPNSKDSILAQLYKTLKPGGQLVFLYDIQTDNPLISWARRKDPQKYEDLFLKNDGHIGYETVEANTARFEKHGFKVEKQIGLERSWIQSTAAYTKLRKFPFPISAVGFAGAKLLPGRIGNLLHTAAVRTSDAAFAFVLPLRRSRMVITVATKNT